MQRTVTPMTRGFRWEMKHNRTLYLMCVPALLLLLAFAYLPMGGMYMAFTKYNVVDGIYGSPFVGFQNFTYFLKGNPYFWNAVKNTLIINFWGLIFGTIVPITIAIAMNEVKNGPFKKISQSAMFFPYFLSWVVVGAILYGFMTANFRIDRKTGELILTGANGVANRLLMAFGSKPIRWYAEPKYWKAIVIFLDVWKWAGYNSIIYMAAMAGFDGSLYEAATIDGASRFQQIRYLTIPMLILLSRQMRFMPRISPLSCAMSCPTRKQHSVQTALHGKTVSSTSETWTPSSQRVTGVTTSIRDMSPNAIAILSTTAI